MSGKRPPIVRVAVLGNPMGNVRALAAVLDDAEMLGAQRILATGEGLDDPASAELFGAHRVIRVQRDEYVVTTVHGKLGVFVGTPEGPGHTILPSTLDVETATRWLDEWGLEGAVCRGPIPFVLSCGPGRFVASAGCAGLPDHDGDTAVHYLHVEGDQTAHLEPSIERLAYDHADAADEARAAGRSDLAEALSTGVWPDAMAATLPDAERARCARLCSTDAWAHLAAGPQYIHLIPVASVTYPPDGSQARSLCYVDEETVAEALSLHQHVAFAIARVGRHLEWVLGDARATLFDGELRGRIVSLDALEREFRVKDYPDERCYTASEWIAPSGERFVVFEAYDLHETDVAPGEDDAGDEDEAEE